MVLDKFGPFAAVFKYEPGSLPVYLVLLRLSHETSQAMIDRVQSVLSTGEAGGWIDALFDDRDWRPHLVGAVALVLDDNEHLTPAGLWRAIDSESWVIPQLVVTAYYVDPEFPQRLVERIEAMCSANPKQRAPKLLNSLVAMGRRVPSLSTWLDAKRADARLAELLAQDEDETPDICEDWVEQLTLQFARRGRQLKPKCA